MKSCALMLSYQVGTMFEGGCRVPTVACWPGKIKAGSECDELAATLDILPTVASLIGALTETLLWSDGNFNGDAFSDGRDLLIWNAYKFTSADTTAVPEPAGGSVLCLVLLCAAVTRFGTR